MSIALDLFTYLNNNQDIKITPYERGILFTLGFYQGSDPFIIVSSKDLSHEVSIEEEDLIEIMVSLKSRNLVEITANSKGYLSYKLPEYLINLHQNF